MTISEEKILLKLRELTGHSFVHLTDRGNSAIDAALSLLPKDKKLLIPAEGGWIHYQKAPKKLGLQYEEVLCDDARINLLSLKEKFATKKFGALLYQNPGGYFAEQPMQEIYELCRKHDCLVIMDVSGAIGTKLCDGNYADILVGSFGEEKLVNAGVGGFVSCKDEALFKRITVSSFGEEEKFKIILEKLEELPQRIAFLKEKRSIIINDLKIFKVVHSQDLGFVVVVKFSTLQEKEKLINYCEQNHLPWTECPRYIRLNTTAISIEVKKICEEKNRSD